ncbi:MAG: (d)CMP kinase [Spirochaetota bacterium]
MRDRHIKDGIKIAISGKSGCGNSTVSRIVANRLGLRLVNYTFRALAKEKGLTFEEVRRNAEEDDSWDRYLDRRQVELATEGNCVLGSRLAVWMLKDADLTVYLTASLAVRAARIQRREGGDFDEVMRKTHARDERDRRRYMSLYNIDNNEYRFVDLVIDTENLAAEQVAERIISRARTVQ